MRSTRDTMGLVVAVLGAEAAGALSGLAAGALLLPYLAWVSLATYLNAGIWRLN